MRKLSSIITREEVLGKIVINEKGYDVGKVTDIAISTDGTGILKVETEDGNVIEIPMTMIQAVGKYVLLKPKQATPQPVAWPYSPQAMPGQTVAPSPPPPGQTFPPPQEQGVICPRCGYLNPSGARFCQNCGSPLSQQSEGGLSALRKKLGI